MFKKCKSCTPTGIMRHLNAGETVFLVVTDKDNGRLRIESYRFEPSTRMKSGKVLVAKWVYSKDSVPDDDTFTAGMCYAGDLGTWLRLAEEYGRRCVPGIEKSYKDHFEWYLTGVHFFDESKKINAEYELFCSDDQEGFCSGIEEEFARYYFEKYVSSHK
ncbi:MAG: hypothetical protein IKP95_09100 [Ruminococcus sp.]|nr:hypothetical protein [Ruminococcus sp.]